MVRTHLGRRPWNPYGGLVTPPAIRRRVGHGLTAAAVRRAALVRAGRYAARAIPYVGPAYAGYKGIQMLKNRRKRIRMRRQVGQSPAGLSKMDTDEFVNTAIASKTLNGSYRLLSLSKTTTNNEAERNTRQRNMVDFRGVKICMHANLNNVATFTDKKYMLHFAIISPKQEDNKITAIPTTEFFRGQRGTRSTPFDATGQTGMDMNCLPINADKYLVHRHKKMLLGPWESTEGKGQRYMETYIPVKRTIAYEINGTGAELTYPEGRDMFIVWWVAGVAEGTGTGTAGIVNTRFRLVKYFKEPKRT